MCHIMIVEDDKDLRKIMTDFLQLMDIHVECAENGKEALATLAMLEQKPSVILLDLFMPEMNGLEFSRAIREGAAHGMAEVPIILLTAAPSSNNLLQNTMHYCQEYYSKPTSLRNIHEAVKKYCP